MPTAPPPHQVAQRLLAMDARQHALAVAKIAEHQRHVLHRVERRGVDDRRGRADRGRGLEGSDPPHQLVAALAVLDQIGDRDDAAARAPRRTPGRSGSRLTVPSSLTSSASTPTVVEPARRQRSTAASVWPERTSTPPSRATSGKMCPGRTKSSGADIAVGQGPDRVGALLGRDAGGEAEAVVDRDRERGLQRRVVDADHRLQPQARAHAAGRSGVHRMPLVWRTMNATCSGVAVDGRHDQIALVLAVVVVDDDDHLAGADSLDRGLDRIELAHATSSRATAGKRRDRWQIRPRSVEREMTRPVAPHRSGALAAGAAMRRKGGIMAARIIDGKAAAARLRASVADEAAAFAGAARLSAAAVRPDRRRQSGQPRLCPHQDQDGGRGRASTAS